MYILFNGITNCVDMHTGLGAACSERQIDQSLRQSFQKVHAGVQYQI